MTPKKLRAIRQRVKAWDMHGVFGDRIALLEYTDELTATIGKLGLLLKERDKEVERLRTIIKEDKR